MTQWNLIAVTRSPAFPGRGFPAQRAERPQHLNQHGDGSGAVYDAVNASHAEAIGPTFWTDVGNTASDEAAVATAAYLVLKNIVETVPTIHVTGDPARNALACAQYGARRTHSPDSPFKNRGLLSGDRRGGRR